MAFIIGGFIEFTMSTYIATHSPIKETTFLNDEHDLVSGEVISFYSAVLTVPVLVITVSASIWIIFKHPDDLEIIYFKKRHG